MATRKVIGVVIQDGDRRGTAACNCGCSFAWNQRTDENVLYRMVDGSLVVFIVCPNCCANIDGPQIQF